MTSPEVLAAEFVATGSEPPPGTALKPATVTADSFDAGAVVALIDGDTVPTTVISLVGGVASGTRVMVLFFPPQGAYVVGTIGDSAWVDVTAFGTNWSNLGGTSEVVQYRRDGPWVTLRGVASYTAGQALAIFTLPAGYRPRARENFAVDSNPQVHSVITPATTGGVEFVAGAGAVAGYVSLSGVRFWAA